MALDTLASKRRFWRLGQEFVLKEKGGMRSHDISTVDVGFFGSSEGSKSALAQPAKKGPIGGSTI